MNYFRKVTFAIGLIALLLFAVSAFAQETTAGLQGVVKDPSGAVIPNAQVVVTGTTLIGDKSVKTDSAGYYRFANLPPGTYAVTIKAEGFATSKREGIDLQAGRLPTLDFALQVGRTESVVEVSGEAPLVDVTTNTSQTTVSEDMINNAPHGYSFQSVIQYAPMARNEPLSAYYVNGGSVGGTGGDLPGSSGSGAAAGYSIGGAADSETTYLVEGQDTENISGGFSNANVPFDFIQEVQVKTSGVEAEHGGALGGVVNVIMRKGGNAYHGSLFASYESDAMDGSPTQFLRYDPTQAGVGLFDPPAQTYSQKKDHFRTIQPGFTIGGPIKKDRVWFFLGFAPFYSSIGRTVNFGPAICSDTTLNLACPNQTLGNQLFNRDFQQYFTTARIDATVSEKVRLFGSWLYQYSRESGASLPRRDPVNPAVENDTIFTPLSQFSHGLGFSSPNSTYNVGADITLTPKVVSTTRFGYFFQNYHDFGWPIGQAVVNWGSSGVDLAGSCAPAACDNTGAPLPGGLQLPTNNQTAPYNQSYTLFNASKHYQFDQDLAFFKSGWGGTHNFKVGYQFNRLSNVINQNGNAPFVQLFIGDQQSYGPSTTFGNNNCTAIASANPWGTCAGQYGYAVETDFATILTKPAVDKNHAFFVQDAWTVGHGLTLNLGIRVEKERLPVPSGLQQAGVAPPRSIDFPWSDKIEPRLGFAWGPASGKMKIFGSYGVINDIMKLLVAQTSWGGQGYDQCAYPLGPDGTSSNFSVSDINAIFVNGRGCPTGGPSAGANFSGGAPSASLVDAASGVSLIENVNFRPWEPIAPGVKPYRQHEYVFGVDYQIAKNWAFEARYDRRRLDHVIEDASLADPNNFEMYTIVNPGEGVNATIDGYANFLGSLGAAYGVAGLAFDPVAFGTCPSCPRNPKAVRDYDGVELRLSKGTSHGWAGMFSYTWSRLWGNYTGLTTTDQTDGGAAGRASPDTTRAFDEPFYYFGANGKSNNGPLPTDRPNTFKGNIYYELPWKGGTTTFGLFQTAYQGTPLSTFTDLGLGYTIPLEATYVFGRGQWADVNQDPTTGAVTVGTPHSRRTPWYTQSDLNFSHAVKVNKNNERQVLEFQATFTNLLNQHAVVGYWQGFDTNNTPYIYGLFPFSIFNGASFYQQVEGGYDVQNAIDSNPFGMIKNSQYGRPNLWQRSRQIRLGVRFSF